MSSACGGTVADGQPVPIAGSSSSVASLLCVPRISLGPRVLLPSPTLDLCSCCQVPGLRSLFLQTFAQVWKALDCSAPSPTAPHPNPQKGVMDTSFRSQSSHLSGLNPAIFPSRKPSLTHRPVPRAPQCALIIPCGSH